MARPRDRHPRDVLSQTCRLLLFSSRNRKRCDRLAPATRLSPVVDCPHTHLPLTVAATAAGVISHQELLDVTTAGPPNGCNGLVSPATHGLHPIGALLIAFDDALPCPPGGHVTGLSP